MNYQETLSYLYSCLPSIDKKGWGAYKPGLTRVREMLRLLDDPQESYPVIHVAGTNGKGSVSHLLASVLQDSGLKVGLFTSPHLKDFRERVKVNGEEISENYVVDFVKSFADVAADVNPSLFEYTFALAAHYFRDQKVDAVVLETGLGGRLDCTNVVHPVLSVITNISLDHEKFLGNTLQKVAAEKAGIIKPEIPVVVGRKQKETTPVFKEAAKRNLSMLQFADPTAPVYSCPLKGGYQMENQRTVIKCVEVLKEIGFQLETINIIDGFSQVIKNTGLKGRWQELSDQPKVVCDVGHNVDGVTQLMDQLKKEPYSQIKVVWGMSEDKRIEDILALLPKEFDYYWCEAQNPRALKVEKLKGEADLLGLHGNVYPSVKEAYRAALDQVQEDEMVFVSGSTFVVSEVL